MYQRFLQNHVLANLTFALVLIMGASSYMMMPREQDPTINFNWIDITTFLPNATAEDVEKRVTDVLEEAIRKVPDVKFVSSISRDSFSSILVRFEDIDERLFDKRLNDLRRELQSKEGELPENAETPAVMEITTSNAFPSATLVVTGAANDENLRRQAENIKTDIEQMDGVDTVMESALLAPELQVNFLPERLASVGIGPAALADTVRSHYEDTAAGSLHVGDQKWLVRMQGSDSSPDYLAELPVNQTQGEVTLGELSEVVYGREKATRLVRYNGQHAVMLSITKQAESNTLELVERVTEYIETRNQYRSSTGVQLVLIDDQTDITRTALNIMQTNAILGLILVLFVTWVFLGSRIAFFTTIGIPFTLMGTFWLLSNMGQTLNVNILLGVVIALGMLVDDAVVVVEAIYYRLQRGADVVTATVEAFREVVAPVTTAVLTTICAFLPLMLLPGIVGKFMFVIPLVVTVALLISLIEAYWMLPAHVMAGGVGSQKPSRIQHHRTALLHTIRIRYSRLLIRAMRYPKRIMVFVVLLFGLSVYATAAGWVKMDFFASDPLRLFYVNIEMAPGTSLDKTMDKVLEIEDKVRANTDDSEIRALASYSGQMFTEMAPYFGDHYGQIIVSLNPKTSDMRGVDDVMDAMREEVLSTVGPLKISFLRLAGGPPSAKPVSVKVRGNDMADLRLAVADLKAILAKNETIINVTDDDNPGQLELTLKVNLDAAHRAGIAPQTISRTLRLLVDGEVVASMQKSGETLDVRVRAKPKTYRSLDELLEYTLPMSEGRGRIALRELVHQNRATGMGQIRHYNFRRTITVEGDIDKSLTDTVEANQWIMEQWEEIQGKYPNISLDFSGELDDIQESLDAMAMLFLMGIGLIYLVLGTQFKSYFQPLIILATVPMAFIGVVAGLLITQNPLSLFTMYGVIALAGIAVNAAIVLIAAANTRLKEGMSVSHATIYAARRRVVPILITTFTTIASLFSLAIGLGGESLIWGPMATAIVWGLCFSTLLTLFVVPLLFRIFMRRSNG